MVQICETCNGIGTIEKNGKLYECKCSFIRRLATFMPPYIRKAEILPKHLELELIENIDKSYYIMASWADMKAVIKAIMIKYQSKFIRITSDAEIRDVYVGSKSKAAKSIDYIGEVYNNLEDLVDPPDLMVVRLNEIANRNKAAPGALEEALSFRLDRDKSTWVLSNTNKKFIVGSFAYSESVAELLSTGFKRFSVPEISRSNVDRSLFLESTSLNMANNSSTLHVEDVENKNQEEEERSPLSRYGQGVKPSKFKRRS
jgi:hypothetical protein